MQRHPILVSLGLCLTVLITAAPKPVASAEPDTPSWNRETAANYLNGRATWWLGWSGAGRGSGTACISCHTTLPIALAQPALRKKGDVAATDSVEGKMIANVTRRVNEWDTIAAESPSENDLCVPYYANKKKSQSLGTESVLNALVLINSDRSMGGKLSAPARKALGHLWVQQQPNGAWNWLEFGLNPWEKMGEYYGASLAAVAVGMAGPDYYDGAEVRAKVASLRKYLAAEYPNQPLHHRVVALWGDSYLPESLPAETKKKLIEELFAAQEADGGWSIPKLGNLLSKSGDWKSHGVAPDGAVSDGYATGLVVLALKRAGVPSSHVKLQKGIDWLATSQKEGVWPLTYPNKPRDPKDDVGKFMRDAATAFAILALSEPGKQ
jgi:squalene-hopene/tetraprenyl-beta-curcumene cyclase